MKKLTFMHGLNVELVRVALKSIDFVAAFRIHFHFIAQKF